MKQEEIREKCLRKRIECLEQREQEHKHQLAEKDEEIEELKAKLKSQKLVTDVYSTIAGSNATKMSIAKEVRHQVCEEIRDFVKDWNCITDENYEKMKILYFEIIVQDFFEKLDQIEGESE